ncbi:MAG: aspartate aminotransferase family protein [Bacteroidetes bacterium]|jgi:acetylornithine/N-succinyldiaminopimelate aminotransferase|nr:aspartate aminotransferase family protein [Bacteroidota bacterium]MBK8328915.1 aspartate aminotransferase family protein [Bacteroidota bacterium]MBK9302236.1 aspartate aminotransferase family protein [Bacteroidota bacterium]
MTQRQLFLHHVAQTSDAPLCFEVSKANGVYLYDAQGKKHIDLIGGISVCNVGHGNQHVIEAIKKQVDDYLHVMVYGEVIQSPQVQYATALASRLPSSLQSIYFTNSGSEATEGAMKLAKRVTGRSKMISFKKAYHGSTQGALSVMGSEYWQQAFRPLLPDIFQFQYNSAEVLSHIDEHTACIILEPVQSEAGVLVPDQAWLKAIRTKCDETGCLLIFDEIQTAFGRTGTLFRFEAIDVIPDILLLGKALGGGMPLGAFVSSKSHMDTFTHHPVLGHITTFGGHPVSCAAGLAAWQYLQTSQIVTQVSEHEKLFTSLLKHPSIIQLNSCGLLMALHFDSYETNKKIIDACIAKGVFTDWFLFASNAMRIAPPLTINEEEIRMACDIILEAINEITC